MIIAGQRFNARAFVSPLDWIRYGPLMHFAKASRKPDGGLRSEGSDRIFGQQYRCRRLQRRSIQQTQSVMTSTPSDPAGDGFVLS